MKGTTIVSLALLVAACSLPAPVPEGYAFPTWSVRNGGAAALMEGDLVAAGGCLYVSPDLGPRYLVVWPDTLRLVIEIDAIGGDIPLVMDGANEVARIGQRVRLGGGEIGPDLTPRTAGRCDRTNVWGANSLLPPAP